MDSFAISFGPVLLALFMFPVWEKLYHYFKTDPSNKEPMKYWGPTDVERKHFHRVSLSHNPKKVEEDYLTFIEMPPRII